MQQIEFDKMFADITTKTKVAMLPFFYATEEELTPIQFDQLKQMGLIAKHVLADKEFNSPAGYTIDGANRHLEGKLFIMRKGRIVPAATVQLRIGGQLVSFHLADEDSISFERELNNLLKRYGAQV